MAPSTAPAADSNAETIAGPSSAPNSRSPAASEDEADWQHTKPFLQSLERQRLLDFLPAVRATTDWKRDAHTLIRLADTRNRGLELTLARIQALRDEVGRPKDRVAPAPTCQEKRALEVMFMQNDRAVYRGIASHEHSGLAAQSCLEAYVEAEGRDVETLILFRKTKRGVNSVKTYIDPSKYVVRVGE
jgi:hypothetical protein